MHFALSDESLMMRDMFRKFAKNEVEPLAAEIDRTHEFPMVTFKKMADLGLCGLPIPEEWGVPGQLIWIMPSSLKNWPRYVLPPQLS